MARMKLEYLESIYAGWLAKNIGIRLGAPIEGWTYEKIQAIYGELNHYPVDYREFAADDDSNGPLFFLRALEDSGKGSAITAQDVGDALLNYAPFEHGFFWWGGYGISTEHTAYHNLLNGIPAPRSGSVEQNGSVVAEQIGGQIFIDTWGLVAPGNPDLAADLAGKAASVTHGGNGIYGGIFVAVCISHAFEEKNLRKIMEKGLSYIPPECEYARVIKAVTAYYDGHPESIWRDCFHYVSENFGYDKYPGNCHIIPNAAVMILSLLYGGCDFDNTLNICNMCGWDTDCNVGNIATLMGVLLGLEAIDYEKWRRPINDLLICSSVVGSLNIMDIPYGASYIAKLAWELAKEEMPQPWMDIVSHRMDGCHFEFPGSTHAMRVRLDRGEQPTTLEAHLANTDEAACSGSRSLKAVVKRLVPGDRVLLYKKTHYTPADFHDSRYDPCFSPLAYPGQTVHGSIMVPEYAGKCSASLYVRDCRSGAIHLGASVVLQPGKWETLSYSIPRMEGALLDEFGFSVVMHGIQREILEFVGFMDDLYIDGQPDYTLDFSQETEEVWNGIHREISQFTRFKGLLYLEENKLHLSCADFAEAYTGHHNWKDYIVSAYLSPVTGEAHFVNVRVQGAMRSYAAGLAAGGKLCLYKNEYGYHKLAEVDFPWRNGDEYEITVHAVGNELSVAANGIRLLVYADNHNPYLSGSVGISVRDGSHCQYSKIIIDRAKS